MKKTKSQKRDRRRKAEDRRRNKRQGRLQAPLQTAEGLRQIETLDEFFVGYRLNPDPNRFDEMLTIIELLNLIKLQSHRQAIAAMVATVYRMHPERQKKWLHSHQELLQSAQYLFEDPEDGHVVIESADDVDQNMVAWMVSGLTHFLDAVLDLSYEDSDLGEVVRATLDYYRYRCDDLDQQIREHRAGWIEERGDLPQRPVPEQKKQANALAEALMQSKDWYKVAYVAWHDRAFVVGTMDGEHIDGAPLHWEDHPVLHQKATEEERKAYSMWRSRREDPV